MLGPPTLSLFRIAEYMTCHMENRHLACRRARLQRPVQAAIPQQVQPQREYLSQEIAA